jgi:DNA-binding transcriptional LysR family regulator
MRRWTEIRTALMVVRHRTVSAAAATLCVHRATVNRHIEVPEVAPAAPLFLRHARGYTRTDACRDMLMVTSRTDDMSADLQGRHRGRRGRISRSLKSRTASSCISGASA